MATWILFGKLIGVATLVGFGEKLCRKNLPLSAYPTPMDFLNKGDIINCDGRTYRVWEVSNDLYGLLPFPEDDSVTEQTVHYLPRDSSLQLIRRRNVDPLRDVPSNAKFFVETYPRTEYDLTTMRLWTDGQTGHVELHHVRMTGVLGVSDGSLTQTGPLTHEDVMSIGNEMKKIGYWDMDAKCTQTRSDSWWRLAATDGLRVHSVERYGESNEIRDVCEQCTDLIDWDALESGPFHVA